MPPAAAVRPQNNMWALPRANPVSPLLGAGAAQALTGPPSRACPPEPPGVPPPRLLPIKNPATQESVRTCLSKFLPQGFCPAALCSCPASLGRSPRSSRSLGDAQSLSGGGPTESYVAVALRRRGGNAWESRRQPPVPGSTSQGPPAC